MSLQKIRGEIKLISMNGGVVIGFYSYLLDKLRFNALLWAEVFNSSYYKER